MQDNSAATVANEQGTRILYVEDDARLRRALTRTLLARGIGVDTACNRSEALSLAEQRAYPVIVTDLLLPETDGVSLANELRCVQPDASFIITTGFEVELRAMGGLDDSIACYLKKPWRDSELTEAVENAHESYRVRRSTRAPAAQHYKVLIVEPDAADAYQLTLQLQNTGLSSEPAHCATLASSRQLLEQAQFDVVLASLELPDGEGVTAVQQLRAAAPDAALVMLSAAHSGTTRSAALCSGAGDCLPKEQLDPEQLRRAVQSAVERMRNNQRRQRTTQQNQDPLTRLPNKQAFCDKLDEVVARSRRADQHCAVMLLTLEGLKQIEQAHGQDAVEEVLCEMGRRVQASVREEDTVGRMSETEFGILVEDVEDVQVCERVARRLLSIAAVPVLLRDELDVFLKLSVGIALCPDSAATSEQLLQAARAAMGTAKANDSGFHLQPPTDPPVGTSKRRTG